ncbi:MAG: STT3 domain-containing protein [Candidatus Woesearchaeota archaeon]
MSEEQKKEITNKEKGQEVLENNNIEHNHHDIHIVKNQKKFKKINKHEKEKKREESDENISINFAKIKKIFLRKKTPLYDKNKEEEISINPKVIKNFLIKNKTFFLILIPLIVAIFFRMHAASLSFTDDWAKSTVINYYKTQIRAQIDQQYPNLPEKNKEALVEQEFSDFSKQNKAQIDVQIKDLSKRFKEYYKFEDGKNYMPDIDPYVYLRYAENYIDHGYIGDEKRIINGKEVQWDTHQIAPLGVAVTTKDLHPYILAYLYYAIKIFDPSTTPMNAAMFFPVIFSALSIIPAFFIGRKLGGDVAGFFASLMLAINSSFLGRTLFGHADTDAYNIFFPLFAVWLLVESFDQKNEIKKSILAVGSGLFIGFFSFAWGGWWYIFDFIIGMFALYTLYIIIFERKINLRGLLKDQNIKNVLWVALLFIFSSAIFISLLHYNGISEFVRAPLQPIAFSKLKIAAHGTLWPNVYTTVAELNPASFSQIISSLGGNFMFIISLIGIGVLVFIKKEKEIEIPFTILIILWYIGIFYACTKGIRFTMMLAPPFAITFGVALGAAYKKGISFFENLGVEKIISSFIILFIFLILLISPLKVANAIAKNDVPIINDAWYNSLNKIKIVSEKNAIVNSWWDFGHHFKYYTDRAVTFDGGTQNTPMAHWIGKVLLTDDEKLAVGILRMLDCGSNTAFEKLNNKIDDVSASVKILYEIVKLDKGNAKNYLIERGLSSEESEEILSYTHCAPPENYFITSEDMVGKAGVWAHFGSWDFDRADIWVYAKNLPRENATQFIMKNMNVSRIEAERLYLEAVSINDEDEANNWISPWPTYLGISRCDNIKNETLSCDNGIKINLINLEVEIPTQQGIMRPYSLVYETEEDFIEKKFNSTLQYSIALLNKDSPYIVVMHSQLAKSMFTRLYYFEGRHLKNFKLFSHEQGLTGTNIYVWKVDWKGEDG